MGAVIGGILLILGVLVFGWYLKTAFFGKCPYCGSKDFVPDDGLFFYCNGCRRKF